MSGHSKWANIKRRKGAQDVKRGKAFTKAAKEVMLAAKHGGDPNFNPRLRTAIAAAKAVNLPKDKIDTAIKKGTGELQSETFDEVMYEGYGPSGVAILVEAATDNKNRTVADVRHIFSRRGGNMGESGSVAWMFDRKGMFVFSKEKYDEDTLLEIGLEAGAEDVAEEDDSLVVTCAFEDFGALQQAFDDAEMIYESAETTMIAQNNIDLDLESARKLLDMMEALEDHEDVQNVYANFDMSDEVMAEL
ncbi:MAG: YebC/PmpR family DNA-binding transcriptional regulator [Desulfovibrio sp.]|uniref:YebC/PmpR family DNA-binding transcriptional regulator n=1 Tax=Desulfovibrio sp. 7SRBS1 TaxID=3378064 RepID=UPI003B41D565